MFKDKIYLCLGSNMGNREGFILEALKQIKASDKVSLLKVSPAYETEPVGFSGQEKYLNIVAKVNSDLQPEELLKYLENIENRVGKKAEFKNGPREIDIDILLYKDTVVETEKLTIPHPGLNRREFALKPLLDLEPNLTEPTTNRHYSAYLEKIHGDKEVILRKDINFESETN